MAVNEVMIPFRAKARIKAGPATPAAIPVNTKIPAPIMPPMPIMVMVNKFKLRLRVTPVEKWLSGSGIESDMYFPFTAN